MVLLLAVMMHGGGVPTTVHLYPDLPLLHWAFTQVITIIMIIMIIMIIKIVMIIIIIIIIVFYRKFYPCRIVDLL